MTPIEYQKFKGLKKENLRDNMTNLELVLNMLAETATTEISEKKKPKGFYPSKVVAKRGGRVAGNARNEIERQTGKNVITSTNAKSSRVIKNAPLNRLIKGKKTE